MGNFFDAIKDDLDALDEGDVFRRSGPTFGVDYDSDSGTVLAVQNAVNAAGYSPPLTTDGIFGPNTAGGVSWLQGQKGITVTGVIDAATLGALGIPVPAASKVPASTATQKVLPDKSTPLTAAQAAAAFNAAYKKVTGSYPTPAILGLLLAQSALETGNWGAGIHNYNFGNAKATASFPTVQYFTCTEMVNGELKSFSPPDPTCRFQAFANATDGAAAYIQLLKGRPNWWAGLQSGTTAGFVQGLTTAPAYFTASPSAYQAGLDARLNEYAELAGQIAGTAAAVVGTGARWALLGSLGIWLVGGVATVAGVFGYRAIQNAKARLAPRRSA